MDKFEKVRALLAEAADVDIAAYTGVSVPTVANLRREQQYLETADARLLTTLSGMYDDQHRETQITDRVMAIIKKSPNIAVYKAVNQATDAWELEHAELVPARVPANAVAGQDAKDTAVILTGADRLAYHRGEAGEIMGRARCTIGGAGPNIVAVWTYQGSKQPLEFTRFSDDGGAARVASCN